MLFCAGNRFQRTSVLEQHSGTFADFLFFAKNMKLCFCQTLRHFSLFCATDRFQRTSTLEQHSGTVADFFTEIVKSFLDEPSVTFRYSVQVAVFSGRLIWSNTPPLSLTFYFSQNARLVLLTNPPQLFAILCNRPFSADVYSGATLRHRLLTTYFLQKIAQLCF